MNFLYPYNINVKIIMVDIWKFPFEPQLLWGNDLTPLKCTTIKDIILVLHFINGITENVIISYVRKYQRDIRKFFRFLADIFSRNSSFFFVLVQKVTCGCIYNPFLTCVFIKYLLFISLVQSATWWLIIPLWVRGYLVWKGWYIKTDSKKSLWKKKKNFRKT